MLNFKKIFTPDKSKVKEKQKIFVGNARLNELSATATIDLTVLARHEDMFRTEMVGGEPHFVSDITLIPFKNGVNRFGNTHYIIIKNK